MPDEGATSDNWVFGPGPAAEVGEESFCGTILFGERVASAGTMPGGRRNVGTIPRRRHPGGRLDYASGIAIFLMVAAIARGNVMAFLKMHHTGSRSTSRFAASPLPMAFVP